MGGIQNKIFLLLRLKISTVLFWHHKILDLILLWHHKFLIWRIKSLEESTEPGKEADPNFSRSMQTNPYPSWNHAKAVIALVFQYFGDPCFDCLSGTLMKPLFPLALSLPYYLVLQDAKASHRTLFWSSTPNGVFLFSYLAQWIYWILEKAALQSTSTH